MFAKNTIQKAKNTQIKYVSWFLLATFFLNQNNLSQKTLKQFIYFFSWIRFLAPILEFPGSNKNTWRDRKFRGELRSIITMIGEGPMSTPLAVTNARRLVTCTFWRGGGNDENAGELFGFRIKVLWRPWVILLRGMVLLRLFFYQNFGDFCKGG